LAENPSFPVTEPRALEVVRMKAGRFTLLAATAALLVSARPAVAGTISGRVLDAAGKAVSGARVAWTAYRTDDETLLDETLGREAAPAGDAAADEQGRFRVAIEKPGQLVTLKITAPGLPSALLSGPYDSSETVELADVHLPSAARLTGRVADEGGKPVPGARVFVVAGGGGASEEDARFSAEARTGPDGTFTTANAPDGPRVLLVRAEGFVPFSRFSIEAHPEERLALQRGGSVQGTVTNPSGAPVEGAIVTCADVAARTDASGAYTLAGVPFGTQTVETLFQSDLAARREGVRVGRDGPASVALKLARAGAAAGTVVDEATRKPISGARVSVLNPGRMIFGRTRAQRVVRTDAKGQFRAAGLGAHHYTFEVSRAGYLPVTMQNVAVSLNAPANVAVALPREATLAGLVKDEKGQAVAGARVRIEREPNMRAFLRGASPAAVFGQQSALTGPDGAFVLKGLAAHKNASLEASKAGFSAARKLGVSWKTGEQVKNVLLTLKVGLLARGKVVDSKDQPVAGAEVFVQRHDASQGGRGRGGFMLRGIGQATVPDAVTRADGSFSVAGLDDGEYSVSVTREGYAPKNVASLAVKGPEETRWPPIALAPGTAVAGQVKNAQGQPIPGAQVLAIGESLSRPKDSVTDGDGRFRIAGLAAERALILSVSADGFASVQRSVTPPAEDMSLVLKSTGTVRGRVEDAATHNPVTDFTISRQAGGGGGGGFQLQIRNGQIGNGTRSFQSTDGTFELTDVPPGKWTVQASASGYRPANVSAVEVSEGEVREGVVLSLKAGGTLAGRVLDPRSGTGVANASVTWRSQGSVGGGGGGGAPMGFFGGASNNITSTDADGKFSFDGLPEGKVTLTASHTDYLEATQDVSPDQQQSVDMTLGTGGSISGMVASVDGRTPVAGSRVSLNEEGDTSGFAGNTTNADGSGNFLFDHLRGGRYLLTATTAAGTTAPKEVVLGENQAQSGILLQATAGALVHGTVTGLPPAQLGGVRVNASLPSYTGSAVTDDSGNFSIPNVPNSPAAMLRLTAITAPISGRSTTQSVSIEEGVTDVPVQIEFQGASSLSGRVTQGGQPMSGLIVIASGDGSGAQGRFTTQTDSNGSYSIQGMTDGDYQVMVSGQGLSYRKQLSVSGATAGDLVLPTVSVTGSVVDSSTGQPVSGATVQAETGAETQTVTMKRATTDSNGNYTIDNVDAGTYQVTARSTGYQLQTQSLSVGTDAAQLNFQLNPGSGLPIRVLDGLTTLPLAAVNVLAFGAGGSLASSGAISLDSTGTGEIPSLNAGRYSVYVFSDGYAPRSLPAVNVPAPLVTIAMTPGGRVNVQTGNSFTGQLVDSTGALYLLGGFNLTGRLNVSAPGTTWFHIAPGSYQLQVQTAGGMAAYPFTVAEGQTVTVVVK
jgi:protocatechuate 3,4-dioxygenase beta subunit